VSALVAAEANLLWQVKRSGRSHNMRARYGKLPDNRSRQKMAQLIDEL
jgi:hypothetical protein